MLRPSDCARGEIVGVDELARGRTSSCTFAQFFYFGDDLFKLMLKLWQVFCLFSPARSLGSGSFLSTQVGRFVEAVVRRGRALCVENAVYELRRFVG